MERREFFVTTESRKKIPLDVKEQKKKSSNAKIYGDNDAEDDITQFLRNGNNSIYGV